MSEDLVPGHTTLTGTSWGDRIDPRPESARDTVWQGRIFDLVEAEVDLGDGGQVRRQFVDHPGAVAIVALDEQDRLVLIQQYRHPVGAYDWEIPAGLLDQQGEDPAVAAARELAEEVDLQASSWAVLLDYWTTPGGNNEAIRIYLARGLSAVPEADRHDREAEELDMPTGWVSLDEAAQAVLDGRIHNPSTLIGILAAQASRAAGWSTLRPPNAPWPQHPGYR